MERPLSMTHIRLLYILWMCSYNKIRLILFRYLSGLESLRIRCAFFGSPHLHAFRFLSAVVPFLPLFTTSVAYWSWKENEDLADLNKLGEVIDLILREFNLMELWLGDFLMSFTCIFTSSSFFLNKVSFNLICCNFNLLVPSFLFNLSFRSTFKSFIFLSKFIIFINNFLDSVNNHVKIYLKNFAITAIVCSYLTGFISFHEAHIGHFCFLQNFILISPHLKVFVFLGWSSL